MACCRCVGAEPGRPRTSLVLVPGTGRGTRLSIPVLAQQGELGAMGRSPKPRASRGGGNRELMASLAVGVPGWCRCPVPAVPARAGRIQPWARWGDGRSPLCRGWRRGWDGGIWGGAGVWGAERSPGGSSTSTPRLQSSAEKREMAGPAPRLPEP